jgi:hypothetical protein
MIYAALVLNIIICRLQIVWIVHNLHQLCGHPRHEDAFFSHATHLSYETSPNMTFWLSLPHRLCTQISQFFCDKWMRNTSFNKIFMWYMKCKNDNCLVSDDTLKISIKLCYDLYESMKRLAQHSGLSYERQTSQGRFWCFILIIRTSCINWRTLSKDKKKRLKYSASFWSLHVNNWNSLIKSV